VKVDVITYAGQINMAGYEKVCNCLDTRENKDTTNALLVISTPGGDPDAGFRIARALQHTYEDGFEALIPRYCKSAGTLVLIGAKTLYMADRSELGPLDIQIKKGDELYGRNSGLDINQAVDFLKDESLTSFNNYMHKLVRGGLSTRVATEIAVKLVNGIFQPIAAQIEPLRVAEMQRATTITYTYGTKLKNDGKNVTDVGLETLVGGYPSHSFVIDRKEARQIFKSVLAPTDWHRNICQGFQTKHSARTNDQVAIVTLENFHTPDQHEGVTNEATDANPNHGDASSSSGDFRQEVDGDGRTDSSRQERSAASSS
jgi:hypothetical protein